MPDNAAGPPAEQTVTRNDSFQDLGQVMGQIARELQEEHGDVDSTLSSITVAAVQTVPGVDWASISLIEQRRVHTRAATSTQAEEIDTLQTTVGEGPCLDSLRQQQTVTVPDFAHEDRWPKFAAEASRRGAGSSMSFQLFTEGDNLGALNLYSAEAHSFDAEAETIGLIFASHAAIALSAARQESNLRSAMDNRDLIGQAKGILMERHRLTAAQAFELLVRTSSHTNRKLFDIASELATTGAMPGR